MVGAIIRIGADRASSIEARPLAAGRIKHENLVQAAGPPMRGHHLLDFGLNLRVADAIARRVCIRAAGSWIGRGVDGDAAEAASIMDVTYRGASDLIILCSDVIDSVRGVVRQEPR